MNIHVLKCWPKHYNSIASGKKTFEIRKNDRGFQVGDILQLMKFRPCRKCKGSGRGCSCKKPHGTYTKDWLNVWVRYITDWGQPNGQVVMGIELCEFCKKRL